MRLSDCTAVVAESLGGSPAVQTAARIANHAGTIVFNMHSWRFARRGPVWLGTTAGNDLVPLPVDYAGYISILGKADGPLLIVDPEAFMLHRGGQAIATYGTIGMIVGADIGFQPTAAAMRVYPTPTATEAQVYQLFYTRGWQELVDPNSFVPLPQFALPLFVEVLMAVAGGVDESEHGTMTDRLDRIRSGSNFRAAVRADGLRHAVPMPLRNGIAQPGSHPILSRRQPEWPGG